MDWRNQRRLQTLPLRVQDIWCRRHFVVVISEKCSVLIQMRPSSALLILNHPLKYWLVVSGGIEDEVQWPALQVERPSPRPSLVWDSGLQSPQPGPREVNLSPTARVFWELYFCVLCVWTWRPLFTGASATGMTGEPSFWWMTVTGRIPISTSQVLLQSVSTGWIKPSNSTDSHLEH